MWLNINRKEAITWAALAWWAWLAYGLNSAWVITAFNHFSWAASWIIASTKLAVSNVLWAKWLDVAWSMAPFAMPVIWGYLWVKAMDAIWVENSFIRKWIWFGAWAIWWAALIWTSMAPVLMLWGWVYAWYKALGWNWGKIRWK